MNNPLSKKWDIPEGCGWHTEMVSEYHSFLVILILSIQRVAPGFPVEMLEEILELMEFGHFFSPAFIVKFLKRRRSFKGVNLSYVNLRGADLSGSYDLSDLILRGADLRGADLRVKMAIYNIDLSYSNLRGARFPVVGDMIRSNLTGADLRGVSLGLYSLRGVTYYPD